MHLTLKSILVLRRNCSDTSKVSLYCRELKIEEGEIEFSVGESFDGTHLYDPDYNISEGLYNFGAAEPVKLDMQQGGNDYITFSLFANRL